MAEESEDPVIKEAGRQLRQLFKTWRQMYLSLIDPDTSFSVIHPKWDGKEDSRGVKTREVWPALAEFAIKNGIDLGHWVTTLFSMTYLFATAPEPRHLKDPRVLSGLKTSKERLRQDELHKANSQVAIVITQLFQAKAASAMPEQVVFKTVLIHPELDASPLVRYAVARRLGVTDIAKVFRLGAALQYAGDRDGYDEALPSYKTFLRELPAITMKQ